MKISTKILIGLALFLFGSLFASNLILKNAYDNRDRKDRFANYNTVLQQPFKHIKIAKSALLGRISIQKGAKSEVKISKAIPNFKFDSSQMYVANDTLFMSFAVAEINYAYNDCIICILLPEISSIEGLNATFVLGAFDQKTLEVKLSDDAHLTIENDFGDLETLKLSLSGATLSFNEGLRADKSKIHSVKTVEANLQNYSKLDLGRVDVQALKLNASDNSTVELSGRTLQGFMKK